MKTTCQMSGCKEEVGLYAIGMWDPDERREWRFVFCEEHKNIFTDRGKVNEFERVHGVSTYHNIFVHPGNPKYVKALS